MSSQKKRAVIYDFDDTLFKSPTRDIGEIAYLEGTGKIFPFAGWWGRIETLLPPIVPDPIPDSMWVESTLIAYYKDNQREDTNLYLMTGRPYKTSYRIKEILATKNLIFDDYFFRGMKGQKGSDTLEIKLNLIKEKIIHPNLEILEIHEDRQEHISIFCNEAKKWKHKTLIHDVLNQKTMEFYA